MVALKCYKRITNHKS